MHTYDVQYVPTDNIGNMKYIINSRCRRAADRRAVVPVVWGGSSSHAAMVFLAELPPCMQTVAHRPVESFRPVLVQINWKVTKLGVAYRMASVTAEDVAVEDSIERT